MELFRQYSVKPARITLFVSFRTTPILQLDVDTGPLRYVPSAFTMQTDRVGGFFLQFNSYQGMSVIHSFRHRTN